MSHIPSMPPAQPPGGPGIPPHQAWPPPPRTARPAKTWLAYGLTAFLAFGLGAAVGAGSEPETRDIAPVSRTQPAAAAPRATVTVTQKVTVTPTPTAEPGPATTVDGDGQYLVGTDMKAGTYLTAGPAAGLIDNCYWSRRSDASGEFEAIIANGNVQGQARVAVRKGEYFETAGCKRWRRVG